MPEVSVIIPVYRTEAYLPACLDSVLGQTLQDFEVICIDDCSPDRCGEILDAYAARDGRVRVIHLPENRRQGYGRNRGLDCASGKYVYFLDSDDLIDPETLEKLSALADREALDAVFFDSRVLYESEEMKNVYRPPLLARKGNYRDGVYAGKDLLDELVRQNEWTCYPQRIFWRREFLLEEGIRYPEGTEHEDEFFAFAGILAARRARVIPEAYFVLRVRPGSVMTSPYAPKNFHGYLMNFYHMNRFLSDRGLDTSGARTVLSRIYERFLTMYHHLRDEPDLGAPFAGEPDRTVYRCFLSCIQAGEELSRIDPEVLERIRQYRTVYIYGAKLTGQRFCEKLERQGDIRIGGFLVRNPGEAPETVMGRRVCGLDEAEIPADAVVVVATKQMFWEETRVLLEERNIPCLFHRKL